MKKGKDADQKKQIMEIIRGLMKMQKKLRDLTEL